ncbi:hypothetical protein [Bacteroides xylanisolvens]|nr:hypothetical protein [Bacteroides xylanisolvens]
MWTNEFRSTQSFVLLSYLWTDAAKDRDNYKQYYEYYQEQAREQKGNK